MNLIWASIGKMQFKDVIGQKEAKELITKSIREGRIPHAQLYWGGEGVGKLALALATVQYINCEHPTDTDSCGECESCRLIAKLSHPDVHFVFPIVKTGSKNAFCDEFMPHWRDLVLHSPYFNMHEWMQEINNNGKVGTIYTTESEAIARKLSLKSLKARFKTVIIWLPELMQEEGANKLLKLLEEPPEGTLFLLVSEQPERMLGTIASRTQSLHIKSIDVEDLGKVFPANVARLSGGNYVKARELVEARSNATEMTSRYRNLMLSAFRKDLVALRDIAENAAKSREECLEFLKYAARITRETFIANLCNPQLCYSTDSEAAFIEKFKKFVDVTNIEQITEHITQASLDIERNANIKITVFDMGLQLFTLINNKR